MICVGYGRCQNYDMYLYQGENGKECVSAETCLSKEGWYPYSNMRECLEIDPAPDGDFFERADGVYSCKEYSIVNRAYVYPLLYFSATAQCVSRAKCFIGLHNIYYSYYT